MDMNVAEFAIAMLECVAGAVVFIAAASWVAWLLARKFGNLD